VRPPGDGERGYIYAGGCAGVLLAYLAGIVLDSAPEVVVALLCLPVAGVITILLDDWVVAGSVRARWLLVAALAFCVNLLAAGGVGYASVALSGWLLMALAVNRRDNTINVASTDRLTRQSLADRALLPLALVLLLACYVTAYAPVVRASQRLFDGQYFQRTGQTARAIEAYQAAAESDARWPEPWMHQASLRFQIWRHDPTLETWAPFADSLQHALRRNSQSSVAFRQAALWYLIAHSAPGSTASESHRTAAEGLPIAVQYVDRACRLHPHAAMRHAELAWVLWLAGEKPRAIQEADEALRLDALMPDELQKLAAQSLFDGQLGQLPEVPADVNNAEQLMHWLRRTATSQSPDE
jgi:tetratricopeptide (TPR) repeat protein